MPKFEARKPVAPVVRTPAQHRETIEEIKAKEQPLPVSVAISSDAVSAGAVFEGDDAFAKEAWAAITAPETVKRAACKYAIYILAHTTAQQRASYAKPYSKYDDKDLGNAKPDWWQRTNQASGETEKGQWFQTYGDNTPWGRQIIAELDGVQSVIASKGTEGPDKYKSMPNSKRETELGMWRGRRNRNTNYLRDAVEVINKMELVRDKLGDTVQVDFNWIDPEAKNKVLAETICPITIANKITAGFREELSVSDFLALDVDKAVKEGGTYVKLLESGTKKRATKKAGPDSSDAAGNVKFTVPVFERMLPDLLHFMKTQASAIHSRLNTTDAEESRDLIITIAKLKYEFEELYTYIDKQAELYIAQEMEAKRLEAIEKLAARKTA